MKILLIAMLACGMNVATAQTRKIDSLNLLIKVAKTDTARINLLNKKIYLLNQSDLEAALTLGKSTVSEARKINYKKGEVVALTSMASGYTMKGGYDSARGILTYVEKTVYTLGDSDLIAMMYAGMGMFYGVQSNYDTSIIYYRKAVDLNERLDDKISLGRSYGNLAIGYLMQSNFPQALLYQQKALKLAEETNNEQNQAYVLMNMGSTYQNIGDTTKALQSLLRGIEIAKKVELKNVELYGYSNLAELYNFMKEWNKSYAYAMKAEALSREMGDAGIRAASMAKAAFALLKTKRYARAEALTAEAIFIADTAKQPLVIYQTYSTMGLILTAQEKYKSAIPFLEKSITTLKSSDGYDESIADAYASLSTCYENTGEYAKALFFYKKSAQIIDSVRGKENIRKATELSVTYDFEKKQAISDALQAKKNAETRSKQVLMLGGLLLALIIAAGGWLSYRNKQKAHRLLQLQKEKIERTLSQLKSAQSQLIQSEKMASLGELTAGIAHEIQNPLNFVNNFSDVNKELLEELKEEADKGNLEEIKAIANDVIRNEEKINQHGKRADAIVKGMLQHSQSSSGKKEPADLNALTDEYLRLSYHGLRAKDTSFNATMKTDYDNSIGNINIIPQDIGRVILNLINNAFYVVDEKKNSGVENYQPTVSISTKKVADKVEIRVADNGNGIPKKVLEKIFQPFFTTKPTGQGTGLGLSLSYDIIKAHGGEIKVETKEGEGTEFIILL